MISRLGLFGFSLGVRISNFERDNETTTDSTGEFGVAVRIGVTGGRIWMELAFNALIRWMALGEIYQESYALGV